MAIKSISLPSKVNLIDKRIEQKLKNLKTKEELSTSGSETISIGLSGLAELYECINEFLILPQTQQALSLGQHKSCVGELLMGCSMLLNACNDVKEIVFQQIEAARGLQSALSIRKESLRIQRDVAMYSSTRKEVIKRAKGVIMSLKQLDDVSFVSGDYQTSGVIRILRCLSIIIISVSKSLLSFLSMKPKLSLVSIETDKQGKT